MRWSCAVIHILVYLTLLLHQTDAKGGSKIKPKPGGSGRPGGSSRPRPGGTGGSSDSGSHFTGTGGYGEDMEESLEHFSCDNSENGTDSCIDRIPRFVFRNASHEERLLTYLFLNYDPVARATMDTGRTVEVSIEFMLLRIHGLDERSQVLTTTGLIISDWRDDRLVWDPEKFGNLTDIIVKADKVWLPELALMNGAEELIPDFERIRVLLRHNGTLHWEPGGIFRTTCDIDISFFPFDTQHCPLLIGAYSYHSERMNITSARDIISTHDFQPNGEWDVYRTSADWNLTVLECCQNIGYPHVVFTLHMKRRHKFYIMNIVLPCLMLSLLIMVGFFLPPDAGEKISLGISVLLAFTVFLLMIADNIPRTSLAIPLIVIYLMATMMLGTVSICMTVVVLNVHHRAPRVPVSPWLKVIILYYCARAMCIRTRYQRDLRRRERLSDSARYDKSGGYNHHHSHKSDVNKNGILDEMETMGLTAVLNNRFSNGPTTTMVGNHAPASSPSMCSNTSHGSSHDSTSGLKRRLGRPRLKSRLLSEDHDDADFSRDWHEFAQVLDRIFFWVLLVLMTLSAVFILLYPKYSGAEEEEMQQS